MEKRKAALVALTLVSLGCSLDGASGLGRVRSEKDLQAAFASGVKIAPVSLRYATPAQLTRLDQAGMDIWGVGRDANKNRLAYGTMTPSQLKVAQEMGLLVNYLPEVKLENSVDSRYHDYAETLSELKGLAQNHPQIARLVDIGDSWEKTQKKADRDIWALRVGKGESSALDQKPAVLFLGEHHAREIASSEIVLMLAKYLVENYEKDSAVTAAVEGRDIWLVPMVNPDGLEVAFKGSDWRKNTDTSYGGGPIGNGPSGGGVDINRNYGFSWDQSGGSTRPSDPIFRGPKAFSEPETVAIRDLVLRRKPIFLMSYHSYSNLILWPWGYSSEPPKDKRLPAIGKKLAALSGYQGEQSCDLYVHGGILNDWAYGELNLLPFTTEIGGPEDGFDAPYSKMDGFWKENLPGAMYLLKIADNPDQALSIK
ncbi:MAG TPA: M14 family metallopeptidase [Chroococcales cyanobacterium]|jgi:carboxypeptidase T